RQPAPALRRRLLRRRQGQDAGLRQAALLGARDSLPRLVGRVRLRRQRHPPRARGPAAEDARHRVPARVLVPREGRDPLGRGDSGHFYDGEEVLGFEEGNAWVKLHPEAHVGARVAEDVKPPRHREPLVTAGKTLTAKLLEKLVEANVEKIAVRRPT